MTHIAIYTRVSPGARTKNGRRQEEEAISLDSQRERCRARITADAVPGEVRVYEDEFESSRDTSRPAFQRMWDALHAGELSAIYCLRLDRLTGSGRDLYDILDACDEQGVRLVLVEDSFDSSAPGSRMLLKMLALIREEWLSQNAARTKEVLDYKRSLGQATGGNPPFGCAHEKGRDGTRWVVRNGEEVEILHAVAVMRFEEGYGWGSIASELSKAGYRTRKGNRWHKAGVRRLVT